MPFCPVGAVIAAPLRRKPDLTPGARGHRLRRPGEGPGLNGVLAAGLTLLSAKAKAAGSGMPWEAPLQQILESVEGPVAKIIAVIIIIITGLALAFGETSGGSRKLIQIVFGLSIAFAASSFFLSFFSFGGGALI